MMKTKRLVESDSEFLGRPLWRIVGQLAQESGKLLLSLFARIHRMHPISLIRPLSIALARCSREATVPGGDSKIAPASS